MIEADRRPGIIAKTLGSMLTKVREIAELSYDEAAAQLGCEADWLVRVETGFAVPGPDEVARILVGYGAREAKVADDLIDLARRAANPPPWLAKHTSRLKADDRDILLVEAEATLAQVHGCRLIPPLAQSESYFRDIAPGVYPGCDVDLEWELIAARQAHQPAGVTRLLEVLIDETAFDLRLKHQEAICDQIRHLLALDDTPHGCVRIIARDTPFWETRGYNFDVLSYAGTADRIGVAYNILGAHLASGDLYKEWAHIANVAADQEQSRAILERILADPTADPWGRS
jgi:transcriptional regulator with XRE-family HTH domain